MRILDLHIGLWVEIKIIIKVFLQNNKRRGMGESRPLDWIWMAQIRWEGERERGHRRTHRYLSIATFWASLDIGKTREDRGDDGELTTVNYGGEERMEVVGGEQ